MELDNNIQGEVLPEITANYIKENCTSCPKEKKGRKDFHYPQYTTYSQPKKNEEEEEFKAITDRLLKTYISKNKDYGNSFDKSCEEFGLTSAAIRLSDKLNRVKNLIKANPKVNDETIEDTLLDMANYCIMSVMWLRKF